LIAMCPEAFASRALFVLTRRAAASLDRDDPRLQHALARGRITTLAARGQSLEVVQFASSAEAPHNVHDLSSLGVVLELRYRFPQGPASTFSREGTDGSTDSYFSRCSISLGAAVEERLGRAADVERALATVRSDILEFLDSRPAITSKEDAPAAWRQLLPESCAACHPAQVSGFRDDPHRRALKTLRESAERAVDFSCFACHLTGMRAVTPDTAPLGSGGPWAMRDLIGGVTCVSCHDDVAAEHLGSVRGPRAARAREQCSRCHDAVNSPSFDFSEYSQHLGCCGTVQSLEGHDRKGG